MYLQVNRRQFKCDIAQLLFFGSQTFAQIVAYVGQCEQISN
ncbi:hypothetical protein MICAE_1370044 [Microcystis aeruginosa PCC 9806]|uniref:Uncharacterized protein n=1 Tax=Microcystis aeruginosa PCC 9806 TaxID=1160282 RepID=I4GRU3_MICAE|nr:hypothetical protein MICAE_1370044 [Microcystis aeruginosa PCC 9806]